MLSRIAERLPYKALDIAIAESRTRRLTTRSGTYLPVLLLKYCGALVTLLVPR